MCVIEDMMNILDDCDILEKVVNMTHEHNDVTVSIKVQKFRSRHAKYVHYNCTRVLCECRHGYKRDREPSRVPMKMLKRPSEKSRKLQNYVQGRFSKNVPKSSEVHDLIKNNATRKKSTQESGLHKKWEGNQFLEQETLTLQWDMSTIQEEINMERNISNT